ncbi:titin homolog [Teleopsis dalmanni]|uniref:titin homolog n=1 Tax=Teleopsis dalmanni TaxID=139649 RepID=UPI0018CD5F65|nr:titin homolog [Teleopsis dalmanni]
MDQKEKKGKSLGGKPTDTSQSQTKPNISPTLKEKAEEDSAVQAVQESATTIAKKTNIGSKKVVYPQQTNVNIKKVQTKCTEEKQPEEPLQDPLMERPGGSSVTPANKINIGPKKVVDPIRVNENTKKEQFKQIEEKQADEPLEGPLKETPQGSTAAPARKRIIELKNAGTSQRANVYTKKWQTKLTKEKQPVEIVQGPLIDLSQESTATQANKNNIVSKKTVQLQRTNPNTNKRQTKVTKEKQPDKPSQDPLMETTQAISANKNNIGFKKLVNPVQANANVKKGSTMQPDKPLQDPLMEPLQATSVNKKNIGSKKLVNPVQANANVMKGSTKQAEKKQAEEPATSRAVVPSQGSTTAQSNKKDIELKKVVRSQQANSNINKEKSKLTEDEQPNEPLEEPLLELPSTSAAAQAYIKNIESKKAILNRAVTATTLIEKTKYSQVNTKGDINMKDIDAKPGIATKPVNAKLKEITEQKEKKQLDKVVISTNKKNVESKKVVTPRMSVTKQAEKKQAEEPLQGRKGKTIAEQKSDKKQFMESPEQSTATSENKQIESKNVVIRKATVTTTKQKEIIKTKQRDEAVNECFVKLPPRSTTSPVGGKGTDSKKVILPKRAVTYTKFKGKTEQKQEKKLNKPLQDPILEPLPKTAAGSVKQMPKRADTYVIKRKTEQKDKKQLDESPQNSLMESLQESATTSASKITIQSDKGSISKELGSGASTKQKEINERKQKAGKQSNEPLQDLSVVCPKRSTTAPACGKAMESKKIVIPKRAATCTRFKEKIERKKEKQPESPQESTAISEKSKDVDCQKEVFPKRVITQTKQKEIKKIEQKQSPLQRFTRFSMSRKLIEPKKVEISNQTLASTKPKVKTETEPETEKQLDEPLPDSLAESPQKSPVTSQTKKIDISKRASSFTKLKHKPETERKEKSLQQTLASTKPKVKTETEPETEKERDEPLPDSLVESPQKSPVTSQNKKIDISKRVSSSTKLKRKLETERKEKSLEQTLSSTKPKVKTETELETEKELDEPQQDSLVKSPQKSPVTSQTKKIDIPKAASSSTKLKRKLETERKEKSLQQTLASTKPKVKTETEPETEKERNEPLPDSLVKSPQKSPVTSQNKKIDISKRVSSSTKLKRKLETERKEKSLEQTLSSTKPKVKTETEPETEKELDEPLADSLVESPQKSPVTSQTKKIDISKRVSSSTKLKRKLETERKEKGLEQTLASTKPKVKTETEPETEKELDEPLPDSLVKSSQKSPVTSQIKKIDIPKRASSSTKLRGKLETERKEKSLEQTLSSTKPKVKTETELETEKDPDEPLPDSLVKSSQKSPVTSQIKKIDIPKQVSSFTKLRGKLETERKEKSLEQTLSSTKPKVKTETEPETEKELDEPLPDSLVESPQKSPVTSQTKKVDIPKRVSSSTELKDKLETERKQKKSVANPLQDYVMKPLQRSLTTPSNKRTIESEKIHIPKRAATDTKPKLKIVTEQKVQKQIQKTVMKSTPGIAAGLTNKRIESKKVIIPKRAVSYSKLKVKIESNQKVEKQPGPFQKSSVKPSSAMPGNKKSELSLSGKRSETERKPNLMKGGLTEPQQAVTTNYKTLESELMKESSSHSLQPQQSVTSGDEVNSKKVESCTVLSAKQSSIHDGFMTSIAETEEKIEEPLVTKDTDSEAVIVTKPDNSSENLKSKTDEPLQDIALNETKLPPMQRKQDECEKKKLCDSFRDLKISAQGSKVALTRKTTIQSNIVASSSSKPTLKKTNLNAPKDMNKPSKEVFRKPAIRLNNTAKPLAAKRVVTFAKSKEIIEYRDESSDSPSRSSSLKSKHSKQKDKHSSTSLHGKQSSSRRLSTFTKIIKKMDSESNDTGSDDLLKKSLEGPSQASAAGDIGLKTKKQEEDDITKAVFDALRELNMELDYIPIELRNGTPDGDGINKSDEKITNKLDGSEVEETFGKRSISTTTFVKSSPSVDGLVDIDEGIIEPSDSVKNDTDVQKPEMDKKDAVAEPDSKLERKTTKPISNIQAASINKTRRQPFQYAKPVIPLRDRAGFQKSLAELPTYGAVKKPYVPGRLPKSNTKPDLVKQKPGISKVTENKLKQAQKQTSAKGSIPKGIHPNASPRINVSAARAAAVTNKVNINRKSLIPKPRPPLDRNTSVGKKFPPYNRAKNENLKSKPTTPICATKRILDNDNVKTTVACKTKTVKWSQTVEIKQKAQISSTKSKTASQSPRRQLSSQGPKTSPRKTNFMLNANVDLSSLNAKGISMQKKKRFHLNSNQNNRISVVNGSVNIGSTKKYYGLKTDKSHSSNVVKARPGILKPSRSVNSLESQQKPDKTRLSTIHKKKFVRFKQKIYEIEPKKMEAEPILLVQPEPEPVPEVILPKAFVSKKIIESLPNHDTEYLEKIALLRLKLEADIYAADCKWVMFVAAAYSYNCDIRLNPYPAQYKGYDGKIDQTRLLSDIDDVPKLQRVWEILKHHEYNRLKPHVLFLLHFVLVEHDYVGLESVLLSKVQKIVHINFENDRDRAPNFIFRVNYSLNTPQEMTFQKNKELFEHKLGYYNTHVSNYHNLLHNGFPWLESIIESDDESENANADKSQKENEEQNENETESQKKSQKETQEKSQKETKKDARKDSQKDGQGDGHGDGQGDSHGYSQGDSQCDGQGDGQDDGQGDGQSDSQKEKDNEIKNQEEDEDESDDDSMIDDIILTKDLEPDIENTKAGWGKSMLGSSFTIVGLTNFIFDPDYVEAIKDPGNKKVTIRITNPELAVVRYMLVYAKRDIFDMPVYDPSPMVVTPTPQYYWYVSAFLYAAVFATAGYKLHLSGIQPPKPAIVEMFDTFCDTAKYWALKKAAQILN